MTKKYQIFVSSTYEDLKSERNRVIQGILELGHIPVGMEMFSAGDDEQWQIIARNIEQSDYYVVIVAHRYGSMSGDVSYTQKEYEHAAKCGIPTIGFVIDPDASWAPQYVDKKAAQVKGLNGFKAIVTSKPVGFWQNADDLYGQATVALVKAFNSKPRIGWVRSNTTLGPEITAEITRLSAENAELRGSLAKAEADASADLNSQLAALYQRLRGIEWKHSVRVKGKTSWVAGEPLNMGHLFDVLASGMVIEMNKDQVFDLIVVHASAKNSKTEVTHVPTNTRDRLLADFMSLDLMHPSSLRHPVSDKSEYWCLSTLGRDLLKFSRLLDLNGPPANIDEDTGDEL